MKEIYQEQLKMHEGFRSKVYKDTKGIMTIGYGHNLEAKGLSQRACDVIFEDDLADAIFDASKYAFYDKLNDARQAVVINMIFNLGSYRFGLFKKMIAALERGDYNDAAAEMLDSKWAREDVGERAVELANQMRAGVYQG